MSDTTKGPGAFQRLAGDRGSKRLYMIGGAVIAVGLGFYVFGGGTPQVDPSRIRQAPTIGSDTVAKVQDPEYRHQIDKANADKAAAALQTGKTAVPTLYRKGEGGQIPSLDDAVDEKPVRPVQRPEVVPPPRPVVREEAQTAGAPRGQELNQQLAGEMRREMDAIAKGSMGEVAETKWFSDTDKYGKRGDLSGAGPGSVNGSALSLPGSSPGQMALTQPTTPPAAATSVAPGGRFTPPAPATILYSRLIGKVNSDVPGPVVAEVAQGPFAHSRLLGAFAFSEAGVLINFTSMTVPYTDGDGEQRTEVVPIHAVAVDPKDLGSAMFTDIDRHLLEKIGVGAATAFLTGFGQAIAQSGSQTTMNPIGGTTVTNPMLNTRQELLIAGGSAAANAGTIFQQYYGSRRTTVTVDADTPFGLLFLGNAVGN